MSFNSTMIAPFVTGLDDDMEDFLLPMDAHVEFDNVHIKHGYIEKRSGYNLITYFVEDLGSDLDISGITQADPAVVTVTDTTNISDGQIISILNISGMSEISNQYLIVANKTGTTFEVQDLNGVNVDSTGFSAYVSGGRVYANDSSDRIMGLFEFVRSDGTKELIAFTKRRAGKFDTTNGTIIPLDESSPTNADIFSSGDEDWVWAENWQVSTGITTEGNKLFFTNGLPENSGVDGIWSYDGTDITPETGWYTVSTDSSTVIKQAKFIFTLKERLILLSTIEHDGSVDQTYPQRLRWSSVQGVANADWNDDIAGRGGYVDAPTGDQIISARQLQNGILVFFTNSIWLISVRSDPALPFIWTKVNDTVACNSKFGTQNFDSFIVSAGKRGIYVNNGSESRRIDDKIELFTQTEVNQDAFGKAYFYRSYANRRTWMLYPSSSGASENDKALIYDENTQSWSTYTIDMNCLGVTELGFDYALQDFTVQNNLDLAIEDFGEETLQSFTQLGDEVFIGGDIEGKIYQMEIGASDNTEAITSTLITASWAPGKEQGAETQMAYVDFYMDSDRETILTVDVYKDTNTFCYKNQTIDCVPDLDYVADVSNASQTNPIVFNVGDHGLSDGDVVYIYGVQGMVQINSQDQGFVVTVIDENNFSGGLDATAWGAYISGGKIYKRPFYKTKVWKRVYAGGIGSQHRLKVTSTSNTGPFRIHAYKPAFRATSRRTL